MESRYTEDSCAQYLAKFYILPHTYRLSIIARLFLPIFFTVSLVFVIAWIVLPDYALHLNSYKHINPIIVPVLAAIIGPCFFLLSFAWRKTVITRHSIDITLSLSKTSIPSKNIVGYALDSVKQSKGPDGWRLSIVHNEPGKPQAKTRLSFDPNSLNEPKLQGLFMSMSNYGDVPLTLYLDDISGNKYPILEKIVLILLVFLTFFILQHGLPAIYHAIEQIRLIHGTSP